MKIKDGFVLRTVGGVDVIVAVGKRTKEINGVMTLNKTGAFIVKGIFDGKTRENIIKEYSAEYEVDADTAENDYELFAEKLKEAGLTE